MVVKKPIAVSWTAPPRRRVPVGGGPVSGGAQYIQKLIGEEKLEESEELGDILQAHDPDLALKCRAFLTVQEGGVSPKTILKPASGRF